MDESSGSLKEDFVSGQLTSDLILSQTLNKVDPRLPNIV